MDRINIINIAEGKSHARPATQTSGEYIEAFDLVVSKEHTFQNDKGELCAFEHHAFRRNDGVEVGQSVVVNIDTVGTHHTEVMQGGILDVSPDGMTCNIILSLTGPNKNKTITINGQSGKINQPEGDERMGGEQPPPLPPAFATFTNIPTHKIKTLAGVHIWDISNA